MGQVVKSKCLIFLAVSMVVATIMLSSLLSRPQTFRLTFRQSYINTTSMPQSKSTKIVQGFRTTAPHMSSVKLSLSSFLSDNDLPELTTLTTEAVSHASDPTLHSITSVRSRKPTLPAEITNLHLISTSNHDRGTPYMLALHIAEQLTMNTGHFVEFLNMAYQWNFTGVEPFIYRSRMFALRSMHLDDISGSVYYHQLLNVSSMRGELSKCLKQYYNSDHNSNSTSQLFVPLREFLTTSVRYTTLVYFSKHMNVVGKEIHAKTDLKLSRTANESITDCTKTIRESGMSENVEKLLNQELVIEHLHDARFEVIQAFCIMPHVKLSLVQIKEYILNHIHHDENGRIDVNIVFVSWQGEFTRPFTDMETIRHCMLPTYKIPPSQEVISANNYFLEYLGLTKPSYISVQIRFEKLFESVFKNSKDPQRSFRCCMLKLDAVLKQLKERFNLTTSNNDSTLLLHDYGPFGSDSCHHNGTWKRREVCINDVQHLLSIVKETSAVEFDPIKFGAPNNAGFVSKVEAVSLTDGQFLIVIGGGSFQASIVNRFRAKWKTKARDYRLCANNDEKFSYIKLNEIKECVGS